MGNKENQGKIWDETKPNPAQTQLILLSLDQYPGALQHSGKGNFQAAAEATALPGPVPVLMIPQIH